MTLVVSEERRLWVALAVFAIIHLLLYPASNGFNSYYDRDEGSIGGLEKPPPVTRQLLPVSLFLDFCALVVGWLITPTFAVCMVVYGAGSKAYSHRRIRLKRFPVASWIAVSVVQGGVTILMTHLALSRGDIAAAMAPEVLFLAALTTLFLMASYPLTQIYQHEEDRKHGDTTMSMLLGVRGTLVFSVSLLAPVTLAFGVYFSILSSPATGALFLATQVPAGLLVLRWFARVRKSESAADFHSTMRTNLYSATGLNLFCFTLLLLEAVDAVSL